MSVEIDLIFFGITLELLVWKEVEQILSQSGLSILA
jgi:hypothetical protein